jgi:flagellar hook assembly protein FlgD
MKIYNSIGQEVTTLVDGREDAGLHEVRWDASSVASGVYFCRMTAADENGAGQFTATQKLLLVK